MPFKKLPIRSRRHSEASACEARHDVAQDGGVILRLAVPFRALDAEPRETLAQPRQRALIKEACQVIRRVRQKLTSSDTNEQIEKLPLDALNARGGSAFRERGMRKAEWRWITTQRRKAHDEISAGSSPEQDREQCIFLRACTIDFVDFASGLRRGDIPKDIEIRSQHRAVYAGDGLDQQDPLGRHAGPIRNGWL